MMAAGRAAERGLKVLLLEKNKRLGEKLRITGGGRCNIANAEENERLLLSKYGSSEQFLYSLFAQFSMKDTFTFFESRGMPLIVEARKRAFPRSQKAGDVVALLEAYLRSGNVEIRTVCPVTKVNQQNGRIVSVESKGQVFTAKEYVFAAGGISHPETGSTGDGLGWLRTLGHTVAKPTPTIVPLAVSDSWVKLLAGVPLDPMRLTFYVEGEKQFRLDGGLLFTHFGISGPLILNNAHRVADLLQAGKVTASLDAFPSTDLGTLEQAIVAAFDANKNKTLRNTLKEFLPAGMQKGVAALIGTSIDVDTKVHSVSKQHRKHLVQLVKSLPMTIEGLMGFDRAVIADGGVPLTEIDTKTMRSKKVQNLFVTGDLLHVNRPSGGYSLQLCWSSGYVAGSHIAE
jgi:predicted Rossmann fold flavoprotein